MDNPRPTKRTKYRACDSCVTSKTRCDDVTAEGCLVCRKRNRPCSLTESSTVDGRARASPSDVEETAAELRGRLDMVEARAWEMEQRLRAVETRSTHVTPQGSYSNQQSSSMGPTPLQPQMEAVEDVDLHTTRLVGRHHAGLFDERLFSPIDVKGYPDAVQRGLVSAEQVDMAFQMFKHRFSKILPFPPFLLSTTPIPSHPFVVTAILAHVPAVSAPFNAQLVDESIRHAVTGAVNVDVVTALLILALCPAHPGQMSVPSPLRLISLAYEIGSALGMEATSRSAAKRTAQLCEPWWSEMLDRVLLWEAIKLQYNIMHMTYTKLEIPYPTIVALLPAHPVYSYHESILHLQALAELVDIFRNFLAVLSEAEAEVYFSIFDVEKTFMPWEHVVSASDAFRHRYPHLGPTLELITFAIGIRGTFWVQTLPTPVPAEEKGKGYTWVYNFMLPASFEVVKRFISTTHEYPRYQLLAAVLAISSARRCVQFYQLSGGSAPHGFDFDDVGRAETKMYAMGGGVARALHKVQDAFKDEPRHLARNTEQGVEAELMDMFDPNDLSSLFNLDFSSWNSLFSGFSASATTTNGYGVQQGSAPIGYPNGDEYR